MLRVKFCASEHMGVSARTGKNNKSTRNSAVRDHLLVCNNIVCFEDFSVLANGTNDFRTKLQGSFLIHCDGKQSIKSSFQNLIVNSVVVNLKVVFRIKNRLSSKFTFEDKIYEKNRLPYFVTSFSVVAAMLLFMVKPNVTLGFVPLDIWESLDIQVKTSSLRKILLCLIIC